MGLFSGRAWFSPRVPLDVKKAWTIHGGSVAGGHGDDMQKAYLFCDGVNDPWFQKLCKRSMVIFHWLWIPAVVDARFRLPIAAYAIDELTAPHLDEHAVPAYTQGSDSSLSPGLSRQKKRAPNDSCGGYGTPLARTLHNPAPPSAYDIAASPSASGGSSPADSANSSIHKRKSIPFVDLRRVNDGTKRPKRKHAKTALAASFVPEEHVCQMPSSSDREDRPSSLGLPDPVSAPAPGSALTLKRIPVYAALETLSFVPTREATLFVPGAVHSGREFRCFYTR
ncbi:hypothetical protein C8Q77DRAFT_347340 [Trametes polyzona]|nr:hypothetical protein C8Q77DRAFT_347340 [Trametes polyzona]